MAETRDQPRRARRAAALLALCLAAAGASAQKPLSGEGVRLLVSGNTLTGNFVVHPLTIAFYPDGTLVGTLGLHGSDTGKWWIENDRYCHRWSQYFGAEQRCYAWVPQGEGSLAQNVDEFRTRSFQGRISEAFPPGF